MTTFIGYLRHPGVALLYLLVYWNRTICGGLVLVALATWLLGADPRTSAVLSLLAFAVAMFNFGLTVGEISTRSPLPDGKRR